MAAGHPAGGGVAVRLAAALHRARCGTWRDDVDRLVGAGIVRHDQAGRFIAAVEAAATAVSVYPPAIAALEAGMAAGVEPPSSPKGVRSDNPFAPRAPAAASGGAEARAPLPFPPPDDLQNEESARLLQDAAVAEALAIVAGDRLVEVPPYCAEIEAAPATTVTPSGGDEDAAALAGARAALWRTWHRGLATTLLAQLCGGQDWRTAVMAGRPGVAAGIATGLCRLAGTSATAGAGADPLVLRLDASSQWDIAVALSLVALAEHMLMSGTAGRNMQHQLDKVLDGLAPATRTGLLTGQLDAAGVAFGLDTIATALSALCVAICDAYDAVVATAPPNSDVNVVLGPAMVGGDVAASRQGVLRVLHAAYSALLKYGPVILRCACLVGEPTPDTVVAAAAVDLTVQVRRRSPLCVGGHVTQPLLLLPHAQSFRRLTLCCVWALACCGGVAPS